MIRAQAPPDFKINPIKTSSGILYQHLGKAQLSSQDYTLLNYYNLSRVSHQINNIKNYYYNSLSLCNILISEHYTMDCKNQLRYINTKLINMKALFRTVSHQLNISANRKRRGVINGIGNAITWLFGNPSADDATFYTDSINSLVSNQRQTHTLMQQQVSVVSETITNLNKSLIRMNDNVDILNKNLKNFNKLSNDIKDVTKKLDLEIEISNHMVLLIEMTDEINQLLENYISDISLIQNGLINLRTLPPEMLYSELQKLSTRYSLPLPLTITNVYIYYQLIKLQSFVQDDLLVIAFKVPITSILIFDVYQMFPLPTPHVEDHKLFSYIEPSQPYILFSTTRTSFFTLNSMKDCYEYRPTEWLCKNAPPLKKTTQETCESQVFSKISTRIPKSCRTRSLIAELEIWHKLSNNQWLFAVTQPTQITILCQASHSQAHEAMLHKIGIFELTPGCKAYTPQTTLESQTIMGTTNLTHKIPTTDISQDDCCIKLKRNITLNQINLDPINFVNLDLQELQFAQHKLNQFDEQLQQQLNKPFIIQKSHWYTTALSVIGGIVLTGLLYKIARWCGLNALVRYLWCSNSITTDRTPCLQIFNQCYNRPKSHGPVNVHYDAELKQLAYQFPPCPSAQDPEDDLSKASLRRSQRLNHKININPL